MWIDRIEKSFDLAQECEHRGVAHLYDDIAFFADNGYIIFRKAIDVKKLQAINADTDNYIREPDKYVMRRMGKYYYPGDARKITEQHRIIDLYGVSEAARQSIMCEKISAFLHAIFGEPAIAMQSLSFQYGSEQAVHQDPAYVISQQPLKLAASWIALEDVRPGSGELIYYPKSHKLDDYLFSGKYKSWTKARDGNEDHQKFLQSLRSRSEELGLMLERFLPEAGDVLIWHADLAHGGAPIIDRKLTRRSLVTHYVPLSVKPKYLNAADVADKYCEWPINNGFLTSRHYSLADLKRNAFARIYYDGGVAAKWHKENTSGTHGLEKRRTGIINRLFRSRQ